MAKQITRIVLTGGPAAGKTTLISRVLKEFKQDEGWKVITIPETSTELISGFGIKPFGGCVSMLDFQDFVVADQLHKEQLALKAAQMVPEEHVIVLYDRALFDNKAYVSDDEFRQVLSHFGLTEQQADDILAFISIKGTNAEVLAALENYAGRNETFDTGLGELKVVASNLAAFGMPEENFVVDLTIARGLDYYTGTVYETLLLDHPELGSVCSGGRYDNLAGYYIEKQLPGVGISIGLTRLFYVLDEQGLLNPELPSAPADALVLPMGDIAPAIALAETLRSSGLRVQLYCEQKKFKQKMAYADKLKVPFAVLLGEDEIAEGKCSVKNMKTGEQLKLTPAEAAEHIKASLDAETGTLILEK